MSKSIYDLKLHEEFRVSPSLLIIKVPGGWLYERQDTEPWYSIFVPFNDEFDPHKHEQHNGVHS